MQKNTLNQRHAARCACADCLPAAWCACRAIPLSACARLITITCSPPSAKDPATLYVTIHQAVITFVSESGIARAPLAAAALLSLLPRSRLQPTWLEVRARVCAADVGVLKY
jgi:hypothetical protein